MKAKLVEGAKESSIGQVGREVHELYASVLHFLRLLEHVPHSLFTMCTLKPCENLFWFVAVLTIIPTPV